MSFLHSFNKIIWGLTHLMLGALVIGFLIIIYQATLPKKPTRLGPILMEDDQTSDLYFNNIDSLTNVLSPDMRANTSIACLVGPYSRILYSLGDKFEHAKKLPLRDANQIAIILLDADYNERTIVYGRLPGRPLHPLDGCRKV